MAVTNTPDKSEMEALERVERRLNNTRAKHGFMTLTVSDLREVVSLARAPSRHADQVPDMVEWDVSGETVLGMRVAAYRETHPEHGNKFGHIYSEHWSTPNYRHPNVKVERLFTEKQVRDLIQQQLAEIERLSAALEPFAACVDQIAGDEDDEEWAKFRLLVKDYRRAANALWPKRKGFARCATCKGEFDEGEWNASSACPECETPKTSTALWEDAK